MTMHLPYTHYHKGCPFKEKDRVVFIKSRNARLFQEPLIGTKGTVVLPKIGGLVKGSDGDFFIWVHFDGEIIESYVTSSQLEKENP